jgi:MFS family permease
VTTFIIARFIGGIGIGVSTIVAPLYISELRCLPVRGRLAGMFQFNIVFGIVVAFASNAVLAGTGEQAWRWMLGVAAVPSVLYTLFCLACRKARAGCWHARATGLVHSPCCA